MIISSFQGDFNSFLEEFTRLLRKSLIHGDKQPAVERTLSFVAKFATTKKEEHAKYDEQEEKKEEEEEEEEEADPFLVNLIQFLLNVRKLKFYFILFIPFAYNLSFLSCMYLNITRAREEGILPMYLFVSLSGD